MKSENVEIKAMLERIALTPFQASMEALTVLEVSELHRIREATDAILKVREVFARSMFPLIIKI